LQANVGKVDVKPRSGGRKQKSKPDAAQPAEVVRCGLSLKANVGKVDVKPRSGGRKQKFQRGRCTA
jgi:hypothetical protein